MIQPLNQYDPRWTAVKMAPSNLTLGRFGCTTTSICWLSAYFNCFVLPPQAVDVNIKYTQDGLIRWDQIKFDKFKFAGRFYGYDPVKIDEALKAKSQAVIFNINHGAHWVAGVREGLLGGYVVMDPWGGKFRTIKKSEIVGYATFVAI